MSFFLPIVAVHLAACSFLYNAAYEHFARHFCQPDEYEYVGGTIGEKLFFGFSMTLFSGICQFVLTLLFNFFFAPILTWLAYHFGFAMVLPVMLLSMAIFMLQISHWAALAWISPTRVVRIRQDGALKSACAPTIVFTVYYSIILVATELICKCK